MKRIPTFLAGMLTMALVGGLGASALAASGQLTITVDPVNVQVNGATFQPKDANGGDVPVFAYNGTTYAPLRALAEAYGLEVGYDANSNMATVAEPEGPVTTSAPENAALSTDYSKWSTEDEAAYQEFKGMWVIKYVDGYDTKVDAAANIIGGPWERWELRGIEVDRPEIFDVLSNADTLGFTNQIANELKSSEKITIVELAFLSKSGEVFPREVKY